MTQLERGVFGHDFAAVWRLYIRGLSVGVILAAPFAWLFGFEHTIFALPGVAIIIVAAEYVLVFKKWRRPLSVMRHRSYVYEDWACRLAFRNDAASFKRLHYTYETGRVLFHLHTTGPSSFNDLDKRTGLRSLVKRWLFYSVALESITAVSMLALLVFFGHHFGHQINKTVDDRVPSLLFLSHKLWGSVLLPFFMFLAAFVLRELEHILQGLSAIIKSTRGKYDVRVVSSEVSR